LEIAVEVQQCPLRSGAVVEVRQGPLRSGDRCWEEGRRRRRRRGGGESI